MERKIQFMLSQKSTMKTKLENMYLQKRISYGYRKVINMMLLSGVCLLYTSFEKNTFSFHNRHSGIWPDIAKS